MIVITPQSLRDFCWICRLNSFSIQPFSAADLYTKKSEDNGKMVPMLLRERWNERYDIEGVGIHRESSMFNHSCRPNARVSIYYTVFMVCVKDMYRYQ